MLDVLWWPINFFLSFLGIIATLKSFGDAHADKKHLTYLKNNDSSDFAKREPVVPETFDLYLKKVPRTSRSPFGLNFHREAYNFFTSDVKYEWPGGVTKRENVDFYDTPWASEKKLIFKMMFLCSLLPAFTVSPTILLDSQSGLPDIIVALFFLVLTVFGGIAGFLLPTGFYKLAGTKDIYYISGAFIRRSNICVEFQVKINSSNSYEMAIILSDYNRATEQDDGSKILAEPFGVKVYQFESLSQLAIAYTNLWDFFRGSGHRRILRVKPELSVEAKAERYSLFCREISAKFLIYFVEDVIPTFTRSFQRARAWFRFIRSKRRGQRKNEKTSPTE